MINISNLFFEYPGALALNDVSFRIQERTITALVGPNGAGKTTLLRCLCALEQPLRGSIILDGTDVLADPRECHKKVGYLSDFFGLYDDLTVRQCLAYASMAHRIPDHMKESSISLAATRLEISDRLDVKAKALSRGLRQRLAIAQAIVHEPRLVILDEPASGLDPEARHSLAGLFKNLMNQGMTLIVSSHILTELEEYSTDMLVLREGRIVEQRSVARSSNENRQLRISLASPVDGLDRILSSIQGINILAVDQTSASIKFNGSMEDQSQLLKDLVQAGLPICALSEEIPDMHKTYLKTISDDRARLSQ